jgi:hypothetical protein
MSQGDLAMISEIRAMLVRAADAWPLVTRLESSLEGDPRHSRAEQEMIQRLRSQISDLILAEREGLNVHTSAASVTLTALEGSIKKRTTGADGWPLA